MEGFPGSKVYVVFACPPHGALPCRPEVLEALHASFPFSARDMPLLHASSRSLLAGTDSSQAIRQSCSEPEARFLFHFQVLLQAVLPNGHRPESSCTDRPRRVARDGGDFSPSFGRLQHWTSCVCKVGYPPMLRPGRVHL